MYDDERKEAQVKIKFWASSHKTEGRDSNRKSGSMDEYVMRKTAVGVNEVASVGCRGSWRAG